MSERSSAVTAALPHLARQFDLMRKGCKNMGLGSWEDQFSGLQDDAQAGRIKADDIAELIDSDYRNGRDGRAALDIFIKVLLADALRSLECPNCHNANKCGDYEGPTCDVCSGDGFVPAQPQPAWGGWTPDQFWEYVEGLTDTYTRDCMRDMLADRGLSFASAQQQPEPVASIEEAAQRLVAELTAQHIARDKFSIGMGAAELHAYIQLPRVNCRADRIGGWPVIWHFNIGPVRASTVTSPDGSAPASRDHHQG